MFSGLEPFTILAYLTKWSAADGKRKFRRWRNLVRIGLFKYKRLMVCNQLHGKCKSSCRDTKSCSQLTRRTKGRQVHTFLFGMRLYSICINLCSNLSNIEYKLRNNNGQINWSMTTCVQFNYCQRCNWCQRIIFISIKLLNSIRFNNYVNYIVT
jgi:hypothetical protein